MDILFEKNRHISINLQESIDFNYQNTNNDKLDCDFYTILAFFIRIRFKVMVKESTNIMRDRHNNYRYSLLIERYPVKM